MDTLESFPLAPAWGFTVGTVGRGLVFFGIGLFAVAALAPLFGRGERARRLSFWAMGAGAGAVVLVMACLIILLLGQQYQYLYVFNNTTRDMPTVYRFSAAWAAQEGSFLLWVMMSAVFAVLALRRVSPLHRSYVVIAGLFLAAMLAIVAYQSPFRIPGELVDAQGRIHMPPTGSGLNPVLQNYWMAIHPWVIFIGFGSLLALFCWAAAAAIAGDGSFFNAVSGRWANDGWTLGVRDARLGRVLGVGSRGERQPGAVPDVRRARAHAVPHRESRRCVQVDCGARFGAVPHIRLWYVPDTKRGVGER